MLEQTFFCIRPHSFSKRREIKRRIRESGLNIKETKVVWLTQEDIEFIYGHEKPSVYFEASLDFMTRDFSEVGIIEGEDAIRRFVELTGEKHIPLKNPPDTLRAIFGKEKPIRFKSIFYYLNPVHRSCNEKEAVRETHYYWEVLKNRKRVQIIKDMMGHLYRVKKLECVFEDHVELVVKNGFELCHEFGGNRLVVELACWLHDIATVKFDKKQDHHTKGAKEARKILKLLGYDQETIFAVSDCIVSHRGSVVIDGKTKEAEIVCSADGLANLCSVPLLFYFAFGRNELKYEDGLRKIRRKVESSYNKLSEFAKSRGEKEYQKWQNLI